MRDIPAGEELCANYIDSFQVSQIYRSNRNIKIRVLDLVQYNEENIVLYCVEDLVQYDEE